MEAQDYRVVDIWGTEHDGLSLWVHNAPSKCCTFPFYRVWCLSHQLNLFIKAYLKSITDKDGFPFMTILTTIIGWLRRQDVLI